jgi:hypothetical protein
MHDVNLTVFDFDYDLTWWAFFIDANERVYSRFGGTGDGNAESRLSVAGLKYTMELVLQEHHRRRNDPPPRPGEVVRPVDLFGHKGKCMHCHQVNEQFYKRDKTRAWQTDQLRFLPVPEDVGLTLDVDAGNRVVEVAKNSPASKAGLRPGDVLRTVRDTGIFSQGDLMWCLKQAPAKGQLPVTLLREDRLVEIVLDLPQAWRKPDLSWRRSATKLRK